jgi:hypothetical protein
LSTSFPEWPILRQTPKRQGIWGNCQFFANQDIEESDFWVVYEGLTKPESVRCPAENTILFTGEPPGYKKYKSDFLKQFATIITCHRSINHPGVVFSQQALPWHVGRRVREDNVNISFTKDYDELAALTHFNKDRLISVICSRNASTKEHRERTDFVERLGRHFGDGLDLFGRGFRHIEDKWDGIARYKYHIVLENRKYPDYWTEKLSDTFLAGTYPLYYGCPNLCDYFPDGSYTAIGIHDLDRTVESIEEAITGGKYEASLNDISFARGLVLNKYNLFPTVAELCSRRPVSTVRTNVTLNPEQMFQSASGIASRLSGILRGSVWHNG